MTNYFKKSLLMAFVLPALVGGVMSCSSDDGYSAVDNQNPTIELLSDHIQTEAGRAFTISGTIKDADGIKSINCIKRKRRRIYEERGIAARQDHQLA